MVQFSNSCQERIFKIKKNLNHYNSQGNDSGSMDEKPLKALNFSL